MLLRCEQGYNYPILALTVGQFIKRKGIDILIKAWGQMDKNSCLLVIGGTPTDEYLELVKQNENQNIFFLPFLEKNDLVQFYQMCDFFVFPTREDIWGLVVNEAMGYGIPVIASDRAAAAIELVEDWVEGFIFESGKVDSLSEKLSYISSLTEKEMYQMGVKSLEKAKKYTIEKMVERHLEVLN